MGNTTTLSRPSGSRFLRVPELAAETGESQAVWRKRILKRHIEYLKLGGNVRVSREALDAWLLARLVPAAPQRHRRSEVEVWRD